MPSPFSGMDPYLEGPHWHSFHTQMCAEISRQLTPKIGPKYVALVEEWLVLEPAEEVMIARTGVRPDVSALRETRSGYGAATLEPPVRMSAPMELLTKVRYIEILRSDNMEVVTVIELLSPANKSGAGREEYLAKRRRILGSQVNLIEIDLLRRGDRPPMMDPYSPDPYFVLVHRAGRRPIADVWPILLQQSLPIIPVPLEPDEADVTLDLQATFNGAFDSVRYDRVLDYSNPPPVSLSPDEQVWIDQLLRKTSG